MTEYYALVAARQMALKEWKEQRITERIRDALRRREEQSAAGKRDT